MEKHPIVHPENCFNKFVTYTPKGCEYPKHSTYLDYIFSSIRRTNYPIPITSSLPISLEELKEHLKCAYGVEVDEENSVTYNGVSLNNIFYIDAYDRQNCWLYVLMRDIAEDGVSVKTLFLLDTLLNLAINGGIICVKETKNAWEYYNSKPHINKIENQYNLGKAFLLINKNMKEKGFKELKSKFLKAGIVLDTL